MERNQKVDTKFDLVFYDERANYIAARPEAVRLPEIDEYIVFSRESPLVNKVTGIVMSINKQYDYISEDEAFRVTVKVVSID